MTSTTCVRSCFTRRRVTLELSRVLHRRAEAGIFPERTDQGDLSNYLKAYTDMSAAARVALNVRENLQYGPS